MVAITAKENGLLAAVNHLHAQQILKVPKALIRARGHQVDAAAMGYVLNGLRKFDPSGDLSAHR